MPVRPNLGIRPFGHNDNGAGLLTPHGVGTMVTSQGDLGTMSNDLTLRAALHLEAKPIRCARGLKSSLVIDQASRADLVV
jgi:hypothetical protein